MLFLQKCKKKAIVHNGATPILIDIGDDHNFMKKRGYSVKVIDIVRFVEDKEYGSSKE